MKTSIIYGSVRDHRQGIKAARFLHQQVLQRKHDSVLIDPLDYDFGLLNKMFKEYEKGKAPQKMQELSTRFSESDGFIIVTGEYNHGVPPALKNLVDHFQSEFFFKPSAIACYSAGPFAGLKAAMQWRMITAELGMPSISTIFPISKVQDAFEDDGTPIEKAYSHRVKQFLDEFEWYMEALSNQRKKGIPY